MSNQSELGADWLGKSLQFDIRRIRHVSGVPNALDGAFWLGLGQL